MRRPREISRWLRRRLVWAVRPPVQKKAFDARYYLRHNPDVAGSVLPGDALLHYLNHGWREGRPPNAWFSPLVYLAAYDDVRESGIEPLLHYLTTGRVEGRRKGLRPDPTSPEALLVHQAELVREPFDERFYAAEYGDELPAGTTDLLRHYLETGWREGRNPNATFDTAHYLEDNTDVAEAGINPFVHYVEFGLAEGRRLRRPRQPHLDQLDLAVPPREMAALWRRTHRADPPMSRGALGDRLSALMPARHVLLSLSHDDYAENVGGVQSLLDREQRALARKGIHYLHLSPSLPMAMLADADDPVGRQLHLRLDGQRVGEATSEDVVGVLGELVDAGIHVDAVVHQLLGHAPEVVTRILQAARVAHPLMWVHDYASLCPSYALLRNGVEFCGAPPPTSTACTICCHGTERTSHLDRVTRFYEVHQPVVLAPSEFALQMWEHAGFARAETHVEPPAVLSPPTHSIRTAGTPLRVAHLGVRSYLKGWHVFANLAERLANDDRYEFLQLGMDGDLRRSHVVREVPVHNVGDQDSAMIDALLAEKVDAVVSWSLAAETFSFTVHESLAAGAYVVARRASGNVWPAVAANAPDRGVAVDDATELCALFESGDLVRLVTASAAQARPLLPRNPTVDHVLRRAAQTIEQGRGR